MEEKALQEFLERIPKDELVKKMSSAGLKYSKLDKTTIVGVLCEFLQDEQNIGLIWNSLSPFEKEYLDEFLKYDERPSYKVLIRMYQKHGMEGGYFKDPWEGKSKLNVFFFRSFVHPQIKRALKKYLTPVVVKYDPVEQPSEDSYNRFNIVGETFTQDFCGVINLAKNVKLSLTKERQVPSKSTILKIDSILSNKDFVFEHMGGIDKIRSFERTNRIYGIFMLLMESGLTYEKGNTMGVSQEAESFLSLKLEDKCRYLFTHYLKSHRIYEISRIVESDYKTGFMGDMTECRNVIIKHLKNCPVGMWVSTEQFLDYIKRMDKNFLINQVSRIAYFSEKHRVYLEPWVTWEEVEGRFVEVVLQEYLSVMGIVDTVVYESEGGCSDYDQIPFFKVEYFRITPLGEFILGMSNEFHYEEKKVKSGFTVEDGFEIKITNEGPNQAHKIFFESFASKTEYPAYSIYRISFAAIVKALDKDISIETIVEYIRSHSYNGIPSEFSLLLDKWKMDSDKVIIKNITVVQMENSELLAELQKELNLEQYMINDLSSAFEIEPNTAMKVKRKIQSKGYYCKVLQKNMDGS